MRKKLAILTLMVLMSVPVVARAQQKEVPVPKDFASIIGVVDDSIRGGRLIGALVTVVGTTRHGTTDFNGVFQIDSITPGEHRIVVAHPLLDTLGLSIQSTPFILIGGTRQQVGARTPTFEDIRGKACGRGGPVSRGKAILVGRVMQADSDTPAAGATVSLLFKDLTSANPVERVRNGRADANGNFAICGLPSTIGGNLQATFGGITTADMPLKLTDESLATAILTVGGNGAGTAVLSGRVIAHAGGGPLAGVQVTVVGTNTVVTTAEDGRFTLDGLPSGTHEAVVRKIGFAKVSQIVHLAARTPTTIDVVLEQATLLGTIHVVGKMDDGLDKVGFLARKQGGRGWYQTPEQIAEKNPSEMTDALRMTNGMSVLTTGTGRYLTSTGRAGSSKEGCINIFIDRARFDQFQPGDVDGAVPASDLGAIEYYREPSSVPTEFTVAGKTCATLVLWTKTRLMSAKP